MFSCSCNFGHTLVGIHREDTTVLNKYFSIGNEEKNACLHICFFKRIARHLAQLLIHSRCSTQWRRSQQEMGVKWDKPKGSY